MSPLPFTSSTQWQLVSSYWKNGLAFCWSLTCISFYKCDGLIEIMHLLILEFATCKYFIDSEKWFEIIAITTLVTAGLVVSIVDPQPGENIIDCCAAPGGKTLFMASRLNGQGNLHTNFGYQSWRLKASTAEITWKNIVLLHILGAT